MSTKDIRVQVEAAGEAIHESYGQVRLIYNAFDRDRNAKQEKILAKVIEIDKLVAQAKAAAGLLVDELKNVEEDEFFNDHFHIAVIR